MNVDRQTMTDQNYPRQFRLMENFIGMVFRAPEVIHVNNTYHIDCRSAFERGKNMALSAFHAVSLRNAGERRH